MTENVSEGNASIENVSIENTAIDNTSVEAASHNNGDQVSNLHLNINRSCVNKSLDQICKNDINYTCISSSEIQHLTVEDCKLNSYTSHDPNKLCMTDRMYIENDILRSIDYITPELCALPEDVLGYIFSYLPLHPDIYNISLTCTLFYKIIHTPDVTRIYLLGYTSDLWLMKLSLPRNLILPSGKSTWQNQSESNNKDPHINSRGFSKNRSIQEINHTLPSCSHSESTKFQSCLPILWEEFDTRELSRYTTTNSGKVMHFKKISIKKFLKLVSVKKILASVYLYISQKDISILQNLYDIFTSSENTVVIQSLESIVIEASCRGSMQLDLLVQTIFEKCINLKSFSLLEIPIVGSDTESDTEERIIDELNSSSFMPPFDIQLKFQNFSKTKIKILTVQLCHFSNQNVAMEFVAQCIAKSQDIHTLNITGNLKNLSPCLLHSISKMEKLTNLTIEIRYTHDGKALKNMFNGIARSLKYLSVTILFEEAHILPNLLSDLSELTSLKITAQGPHDGQAIPSIHLPKIRCLYLNPITLHHSIPFLNIGALESLVVSSTVYEDSWDTFSVFSEHLKKLSSSVKSLAIYLPYMSLSQDDAITLSYCIGSFTQLYHLQLKLQIKNPLPKKYWKEFFSYLSKLPLYILKLDCRSELSNIIISPHFDHVVSCHLRMYGAKSFSINSLFHSFPNCQELHIDCFSFAPPSENCPPTLVTFKIRILEATTVEKLYQLAESLKSANHVVFECNIEATLPSIEEDYSYLLDKSLLSYPSIQEYCRVVENNLKFKW